MTDLITRLRSRQRVTSLTSTGGGAYEQVITADPLCCEAADEIDPQSEPVAEVHADHLRPAEHGDHWCREVLLYSGNNPGDKSSSGSRVKLYAHPPQRQPLTQEQIDRAWHDAARSKITPTMTEFARAIERAHGIGETP